MSILNILFLLLYSGFFHWTETELNSANMVFSVSDNPAADTIPQTKETSGKSGARDEQKLISEYEFHIEKAKRLEEQLEIATSREKSYKEQLEIINLNKINYTFEYVEKIQSEYNTNVNLVKTLKSEQKLNNQKIEELKKQRNDLPGGIERAVPIADLQVSASDLPPEKNMVVNRTLSPPPYQCNTVTFSDGVETGRELLLNFTDPQLQTYLKGDNYISCYSKLSRHKSGTFYLSLTFSINSGTARKDYGQLIQNSACVIYFLSGETITLKNTKADGGRLDSKSGKTIYEGIYILDKRQLKSMESGLASKIRIVWSTGYEDYEIQDLVLLSNQIKCL